MTNQRRRICVVLVDRANYGRLKPVMKEIAEHPALDLQVIAAGTMVLARFGRPVDVVRRDGFRIDGEIYTELEGSIPATMAKSVGIGVLEFSNEFQRLQPDMILLIGDRYEALSAAIAAAYMNICLVHVQGGEVSGSIDESARHAITKLAQYHFPSTVRSAEYLIRMGEKPTSILGVGCPSSDIARQMDRGLDSSIINSTGGGSLINVNQPFLLTVFHPTTTHYGDELDQMHELLAALEAIAMPTVLLWPNIDAGSDNISKAVRIFRDQRGPQWLRTITNLTPENYLKVLANTACALGNSSSFVRDAGYFGTPVVLVGARQTGREHDTHVMNARPLRGELVQCLRSQLASGRYSPSALYGDGHVATRIAEALATTTPYIQKTLHYIHDEPEDVATEEILATAFASSGGGHSAGRIQGHSR